jgi:hypothetical protein
VARHPGRDRGATLALASNGTAIAHRALGRALEWRPIAATYRDALIAAISR